MLVNFLQQFYQLYQGQSKDLDLEMDKLLAQLSRSSNVDFDTLSNVATIEQHQHQVILALQQKQQHLCDSIKELSELSALPEQVSQLVLESPTIANSTKSEVTIASLLDEMSKVVKLYRHIVFELNNEFQQHHKNSDALIANYVEKLISISHKLQVNVSLRGELDVIFDHVKETKTPDDLCNNFQQLINLLVKNINNEKQASSYFLEVLNKALLDVKTVVVDSTSLTADASKKRKQWDKNLVAHVEKISGQLDQETADKNVQSIISTAVEDILKAIQYKERFDRQEYQALSKNFTAMQERLKTVEEEAQGYKSKLDEQKILSMQDSLTKLPNRAALDERFAYEFQRAQKLQTPLWVAVADLDFFKRINDTYGHTAGDKTLQAVASLISRALRESEFIARFGGEEFVILIPDINKIVVEKMLNRVREKVKSIPFKFKGQKITVTISIGATRVKESDSGEYFAFERADKAMYMAKEQGRDRVIIS